MVWFNIDDNLHDHPKARSAGLEAIGLWALCGSFSANYLTEGFVPEWKVRGYRNGKKLAAKLVAVGLWEAAEEGGETGWRFHQWDQRNRTKAQVEAEKAANRERQQRLRTARRDKTSNAGSNAVTPTVTDTVSNGVTNSGSHGVSNAALAKPSQAIPKEQTPSLRSGAAQKRGTRLPPNWQPTPRLVAEMRLECPQANLELETRKFIDYWTDKTGRDATKIDWSGTWRNWIRNSKNYNPPPQPENYETEPGWMRP